MKIILILILLSLNLSKYTSYRYTLPGDANWPKLTDFTNLESKINGKVFIRGDSNYKPNTWNKITNVPKPAVIIQPKITQDVIEALKFAKQFNLRLSVQSTGHHQDHRNILDNSVHLDMSTMNQKSIDLVAKTVTLGPGNNFSQIHQYVAEQSSKTLIAVGGQEPGVGIYGWTTGGGHGPLTRQFGLGVDNLLSIDLVLANYSIITASESQNQELFRAIRGSGGSAYGIAVSLTIKLHDNKGKVSLFTGTYDLSSTTADQFSDWIKTAPNEAYAYMIINNFQAFKYVNIYALCLGDRTFCEPVLSKLKTRCAPIPDLGTTCDPQYEIFQNFYDYFKTVPSEKEGVAYLSSTALNNSNIQNALREILEYIDKTSYTGCSGNAVLGGASSLIDTNSEKTSISKDMRNGLMAISCYSMLTVNNTVDEKKYQVNLMDEFAEKILKKYSMWVYWNEPQHNFPNNDWKERYWGGMDNYNRLLSIKTKIDPDNLFTCYHCIGYERIDNEMPSVCPSVSCTCSNTPNGVCAKTDNIRCWYNSTTFLKQCNSSSSIKNNLLFSFIVLGLFFFLVENCV